jgi:hypothetical protein
MKKATKYSKEYKYTLFILSLEVFVSISQTVPVLQTMLA